MISELKNAQNGMKSRVLLEEKFEEKLSELENSNRKYFYWKNRASISGKY